MSGYFLKEQKVLTSLFTKEMQFKTIEQLERYIAGGGGINWYSYFGKLFGIPTKAKHTVYPMIHQFYYWVYTKQK